MLNEHRQLQKLTNSDIQLVQTYECLLEVIYEDLVKTSQSTFKVSMEIVLAKPKQT
jgi:hypothetical protein